MEDKLFDDCENEKRLLGLMQNKQEFEKYILAKHKSSICNVPLEPFIWAVHFNIPKNNRFPTLDNIFKQSFSHMKTSYGFLPDKQVMGMTYAALGIPTVCGEPSKRFLKAHKKFKVYYPTKRPSKLRKRPIAILKNKYYANKKQRRKTTTNGPKKVSNSPGQVVENQPKVSINGNDSTSCCFGEQTHLDTTLPPLANDDHQDTSWTSPEQSPLIFISRDPNSCVDDNNNSSNSWMDHHEMVTPKLEKHTPKDQLLHLDHSYCSVETVKLTRWQKLQTQDSDSDSDEPLGLVVEDTNNDRPTTAELSSSSTVDVLSSEDILVEDFNRFIDSDMANEAYIEEIVLESSTSSSSLAVDLSAGFSSDSSLEMLIVKGQHQAKSETFTLNTTTSSSSGLNLQRSLTSDQDRWSIGSSVDRPMDSQHSAVDSSGWLQMKINFSSLSFSDSVGSKTVTDEDRRQASDRLSSIDQTFKSNDDDDQDSWDKIKKDIKWSLGFQSQSSWTSSSDLPKQPSWSDDNSIVGPSSPAANHDDGDSDGLERINSDFMSWSSSSAGVANISSNTINNALFRNFSFEDSLYLQMNTSTSSTNYESSLVGIVKMAENIKKTVGS